MNIVSDNKRPTVRLAIQNIYIRGSIYASLTVQYNDTRVSLQD